MVVQEQCIWHVDSNPSHSDHLGFGVSRDVRHEAILSILQVEPQSNILVGSRRRGGITCSANPLALLSKVDGRIVVAAKSPSESYRLWQNVGPQRRLVQFRGNVIQK